MEKPTLNILIIKIVIFTFPSFQSLSPKRQSCAFSSYQAQSSLHAASQLLPDLMMMMTTITMTMLRTLCMMMMIMTIIKEERAHPDL